MLGVFEAAFETPGGEENKDAKPVIKSEQLLSLDSQLGGALADIVATFEFKGKAVRACVVWAGGRGCWLTLWPPSSSRARRCVSVLSLSFACESRARR